MQKIVTLILTCLFLVSTINAQNLAPHAADQLIIQFKEGISFDKEKCLKTQRFGNLVLDEMNANHEVESIKLTGNPHTRNTYVLTFSEVINMAEAIQSYQDLGIFNYVEPNFIGHGGGVEGTQAIPNDAFFNRQWGLYNDGTFGLSAATTDADIDMELAWDLETGDSSIVLAILDGGTNTSHPEFAGRIWKNSGEIADNLDNDNNGYIDDLIGWDFAYSDNLPDDAYGHGTNVAGLACATGNNGIGYAGVDWTSKLMVLKILDDNDFGLYSWWADAIYYAVDHGAKVLNMSVGGSGTSTLLGNAVNYAYNNGALVVACMMNTNSNTPYYPAAYSNSFAVGSTDPDDSRSSPFFWSATSGSNYGSHIDVVAPGNYAYGLDEISNVNYNSYWGGTSQAAPLVTGLCGLLLAQDPSRTPADLQSIIRSTAEDQIGPGSEDSQGFDNYFGYGRVNANQALLSGIATIDDPSLAKNLTVFPNPATSEVFIKVEETTRSLNLVNSMGKLVREIEVIHGEVIRMDVSNLPAGIYFVLSLGESFQHHSSQKIIIR